MMALDGVSQEYSINEIKKSCFTETTRKLTLKLNNFPVKEVSKSGYLSGTRIMKTSQWHRAVEKVCLQFDHWHENPSVCCVFHQRKVASGVTWRL